MLQVHFLKIHSRKCNNYTIQSYSSLFQTLGNFPWEIERLITLVIGLIRVKLDYLSITTSMPYLSFALDDLRDLLVLITSESLTGLILKTGSTVVTGQTLVYATSNSFYGINSEVFKG